MYGAALYRLRAEDFGELRHHDGISPAWPIELRRDGAVLHARRALLPGARRARRGPDRAAGQRAVPVPGGVARAADPEARRRPRGARPPPVPRALRGDARRERTCRSARACAATTATGSRASCTPSPTPRCWACGPRSSTPTSSCWIDSEAVRLEHQRRRHRGHRRHGRARRRAARRVSGDIVVVVAAARPTRRGCC